MRLQHVLRQLAWVRRTGRMLLLAQRLTQWLAVVMLAAFVFGLLDYAWRLPSWLRFAASVALGLWGLWWIAVRLWRVARFNPDLSTLALRAERIYPNTAGSLASAVQFAAEPDRYATGGHTRLLLEAAINRAASQLGSRSLLRLIAPRRTAAWLGGSVLAGAILMGAAVAAGSSNVELAVRRWLAPLGQARWPTRQLVVSQMTQKIAPSDQPLRVFARVSRGYEPGLRTWVSYRLVGRNAEPGPWQQALMSLRSDRDAGAATGRFVRLIDLPDQLAGLLSRPSGAEPPQVDLQVRFEAGDHQIGPDLVHLVPRPAVHSVIATIRPPAYATALVEPRRVDLSQQAGQVAATSAWQGAPVRLQIGLNKPVAVAGLPLTQMLPGLKGLDAVLTGSGPDRTSVIDVQFTLGQTVTTSIDITDQFGLASLSERVYQIRALEDKRPSVWILEPGADEAVLATAVVDLKALAQDDVGLARLQIEARLPAGDQADRVIVGSKAGRSRRIELAGRLDLGAHRLGAGDTVELTANAQDVFELDGRRHEPVRSSPRVLRIVDPGELVGQLRLELGALRTRAMRLNSRQRAVASQNPDAGQRQQRQITADLGQQQQVVAAVGQRMVRNRLEAPSLNRLVGQAGELLEAALAASQRAVDALGSVPGQGEPNTARSEALARQDQVASALEALIDLLDQQKDVLTLQLKLKRIEQDQRQLAASARSLLPVAAGRDRDSLDEPTRDRLDALADSQDALSRQAGGLVDQMQAAAGALSQGRHQASDQAAATSLSEAVALALRQGLEGLMGQSAVQLRQNQLAQAGQGQQASLELIAGMLKELDAQEGRRLEMLRRQMADLAESIRTLVRQQKRHLDHLAEAEALAGLIAPLTQLRINTFAVARTAAGQTDLAAAGGHLEQAASHQAQALTALGQSRKPAAVDEERTALGELMAAGHVVDQQQQQLQADQTERQRDALRRAYEKLAFQQRAVRGRTAKLVPFGELARRRRLALLMVANEQADVRVATAQLGQDLDPTTLFGHAHERIDRLAAAAAAQMRAGIDAAGLVVRQEQVATYLHEMAEALAVDRKPEPFTSGAEGQGGGGGGSGGSAGADALVSALAELKLLRGLQQKIYQRTRRLDQARLESDPDDRRAQIGALADEQRALFDLGQQLLERQEQLTGTGRPPESDRAGKEQDP